MSARAHTLQTGGKLQRIWHKVEKPREAAAAYGLVDAFTADILESSIEKSSLVKANEKKLRMDAGLTGTIHDVIRDEQLTIDPRSRQAWRA